MRPDSDPPAGAADVAHWGSLHDDWQAAMRACPRATHVQKEPLPAAVIIAIVEHRMRANDEPLDHLEVEPCLRRRVVSLRAHARDAQGRNWDILASYAMKSAGPCGEAAFRRTVDALRDQFDIA